MLSQIPMNSEGSLKSLKLSEEDIEEMNKFLDTLDLLKLN